MPITTGRAYQLPRNVDRSIACGRIDSRCRCGCMSTALHSNHAHTFTENGALLSCLPHATCLYVVLLRTSCSVYALDVMSMALRSMPFNKAGQRVLKTRAVGEEGELLFTGTVNQDRSFDARSQNRFSLVCRSSSLCVACKVGCIFRDFVFRGFQDFQISSPRIPPSRLPIILEERSAKKHGMKNGCLWCL